MNINARISHPSQVQIETLLNYLEKNPSLAKGFSRVPSAREATRLMWERLAALLNSLGGCVKSSKQWMKYWADKKSAVKKKTSLRFRIRNKTGGGAEVVNLTEIEERIVTLLGGEAFATGDRHLDPFQGIYVNDQIVDSDSPSLLASLTHLPSQNEPSQYTTGFSTTCDNINIHTETLQSNMAQEPQQTSHLTHESLPGTSNESVRPSVVRSVLQSLVRRCEPQTPVQTPPRPSGIVMHEAPTTPSGSGRHPRVRRRLLSSGQPHSNAEMSHQSRNRRTVLPPLSQRQSHLTSLAERFFHLEQQRTTIMETYLLHQAAREQSTTQALQAIGDGLKMLAEVLKK